MRSAEYTALRTFVVGRTVCVAGDPLSEDVVRQIPERNLIAMISTKMVEKREIVIKPHTRPQTQTVSAPEPMKHVAKASVPSKKVRKNDGVDI